MFDYIDMFIYTNILCGFRVVAVGQVETHQPYRPRWPRWRRVDRRPVDLTTMEVPCAEEVLRTKHGLWRPEHGVVRPRFF